MKKILFLLLLMISGSVLSQNRTFDTISFIRGGQLYRIIPGAGSIQVNGQTYYSFPGFGATHSTAAYGDHGHGGVYEPLIGQGAEGTFFSWDKTWRAVPSGGGADTSAFPFYREYSHVAPRNFTDTLWLQQLVKFPQTGLIEGVKTGNPGTRSSLWLLGHLGLTSLQASRKDSPADSTWMQISVFPLLRAFIFEGYQTAPSMGRFAYQLDAAGFYPSGYTTAGTSDQSLGLPSMSWNDGYLKKLHISQLPTGSATDSLRVTRDGEEKRIAASTFSLAGHTHDGQYIASVSAASPLVSSGGTAPQLSIPSANGARNGYLSSTHFNLFFNKAEADSIPFYRRHGHIATKSLLPDTLVLKSESRIEFKGEGTVSANTNPGQRKSARLVLNSDYGRANLAAYYGTGTSDSTTASISVLPSMGLIGFGFQHYSFGGYQYQLDEYGFYPTTIPTSGNYRSRLGTPLNPWKGLNVDTAVWFYNLPTGSAADQVLSVTSSGQVRQKTAPISSQWTTSSSNIYFNTGNVGVGTASPTTKLHVAPATNSSSGILSILTSNANNANAISASLTSTAVIADGGYNRTAILATAVSNAAGNSDRDLFGLLGNVSVPTGNTYNHGGLYGLRFTAQHKGTGTVNYLFGCHAYPYITGGTATNAVAYYTYPWGTGGTITNFYGFYMDNASTTGATITNKWGVYIKNSDYRNYFAGNVTIGSVNAAEALDVTGNIKLTGWQKLVKVAAHPAPASGETICYTKGNFYVIAYNDAGTTKYRYLDLTGTNANWTYSTTAP